MLTPDQYPRTFSRAFDALPALRVTDTYIKVVQSHFAIQLETELNAANARIFDLEDTIRILNQQLKEADARTDEVINHHAE